MHYFSTYSIKRVMIFSSDPLETILSSLLYQPSNYHCSPAVNKNRSVTTNNKPKPKVSAANCDNLHTTFISTRINIMLSLMPDARITNYCGDYSHIFISSGCKNDTESIRRYTLRCRGTSLLCTLYKHKPCILVTKLDFLEAWGPFY